MRSGGEGEKSKTADILNSPGHSQIFITKWCQELVPLGEQPSGTEATQRPILPESEPKQHLAQEVF